MTSLPPNRLERLRDASWAMLDGRSDADLRHQPHPELSPLLWHIGHVFFVEHFWLAERVFNERNITDRWRSLYFPEESVKYTRPARLPTSRQLRDWTIEIAALNDRYWQKANGWAHPLLENGYLKAFVCQHYAQHLETMRLVAAQLDLARKSTTAPLLRSPSDQHPARVSIPARRVRLGTNSIEAYDNEQPAHECRLAAFEIGAAPVSNAQWLAFMHSGGYRRRALWDAEGWLWRKQHDINHPQHWFADADADSDSWRVVWPNDQTPIEAAPVHGISWYEARAYARYAGARLPTEQEWEAAARAGCLREAGHVWEWCCNALAPYPGFTPFPYAGYSTPWFDGHHYVLRGASIHTEPEIRRPGFRNFYPPGHRHVFAGLRLAW